MKPHRAALPPPGTNKPHAKMGHALHQTMVLHLLKEKAAELMTTDKKNFAVVGPS